DSRELQPAMWIVAPGPINQSLGLDALEDFMQGSFQYPISKLIANLIDASGLRKSDFVSRLGYRNTTRGLRRLDGWLQDGAGEPEFLERVLNMCQPDPETVTAALAETEAIQEQEHLEAVREMEEQERR